MKLRELIKKLSKLDQNAIVIYSSDDEGNTHDKVIYSPSEGYYSSGEFYSAEELKEEGLLKKDFKKVVCIN